MVSTQTNIGVSTFFFRCRTPLVLNILADTFLRQLLSCVGVHFFLSCYVSLPDNRRIRESIYYNRTAKKKARPRSKELIDDKLLKRNYDRLLKLFRTELVSQLQSWSLSETTVLSRKNNNCGDHHLSTIIRSSNSDIRDSRVIASSNGKNNLNDNLNINGIDFADIRHNPEIMMRVYSYLPLCDRIYNLSLVDRVFSKDKIRSGIVCATYGAGFNLKQALLELQRWAMENETNTDCSVGDSAVVERPAAGVCASLHSPLSKTKLGRLLTNCKNQEKTECHNNERIIKISLMLEAANLTDGNGCKFL